MESVTIVVDRMVVILMVALLVLVDVVRRQTVQDGVQKTTHGAVMIMVFIGVGVLVTVIVADTRITQMVTNPP